MTRWHPLPAEVYALVADTPATVLLEGAKPRQPANQDQPWTQLFLAPVRVYAAFTAAEIPALFDAIEGTVAAGQFAAGFFSYECGSCFEPKAGMARWRNGQPAAHPLAWFGIYDRSYVFDHESGEFAGDEPPELGPLRKRAMSGTPATEPGAECEPEVVAAFPLGETEYSRRIAAIHEWIRAGDVYQLNFTAPMSIEPRCSPAALYEHLRARQPVDYGAFLHWEPGRRILSFSPELFFRIDDRSPGGNGRRIVTRPMKGTARRGRTTREDREIADWLTNDPKNRSENVMIVDLVRNDLGRIARAGSVRVEKLFEVERYPTLWQMTSTVSAELRPQVGFYDVFRALFPCGSVTGAPKVRAMQLIAELEGAPRGVYTGAIGFFSPRQTVFNVAIRTLELEGECGRFGVGSGVVIDSDAAAEYRECLLKAEFLKVSGESPGPFSLIETMLWDGGFPLLELHLDRLIDSAEYFDFECERAKVKAALLDHARRFARRERRKVRLLLVADGSARITDEILADRASEQQPGRVRIAEPRTDPEDRMLYHKTTHRPLYAREFERATRDGFVDALFLNLRGEVTEGAISNIFVEKNGRWFTPPVECGLLAGVYRRHLLETRAEIEQRVLRIDDLRSADAIFLANAVRGLRRVNLVE
jgi:para-aminobenzoate synthetase/4-amino-4-deoxychorismate lyase